MHALFLRVKRAANPLGQPRIFDNQDYSQYITHSLNCIIYKYKIIIFMIRIENATSLSWINNHPTF